MAYRSDTIATVINRVNRQYFLPAIQREFVWSPDQIIELFDSVMRGYPIGSFLFWDLLPENQDKWEIYEFISAGRDGGAHNELAVTHGFPDLRLVLDGQQRLTAFTIGLRGTYTIKKKYMWWGNPNAWVKQKLYLNLLHDPKLDAEDSDMGVRYDFRFLEESAAVAEDGRYWFPVGRILKFDNDDRFEEFVDAETDRLPEDATRAQMKVMQKNLARLHRSVWKEDVIAYYTEHDQDYDRVLDIFVRANEGGTKLSKSDLLLSMVTSKWSGVNAREEIYGFVEHINNDLVRRNNFDKDFIMKTCLVVSDLPVQYKVQNFNNANLSRIQANWQAIKSAIERTVNLVNSFGIDRDTLTSANALIPIVYYLCRRPRVKLLGTSAADARNRATVRLWLTMALLNNVFGRAADGVLAEARRVLQELPDDADFPISALNMDITGTRGDGSFTSAADAVLDLRYGGRETILGLSLLYDPEGWGTARFHQDHIFPRSMFDDRALAARGYDAERRARYRQQVDCIANIQLLREDENTAKLASDPEQWLATRDSGFRHRHLIPEDMTLSLDDFEEFISHRENLIRARLDELLGAHNPETQFA
jgi:hypothetical protein